MTLALNTSKNAENPYTPKKEAYQTSIGQFLHFMASEGKVRGLFKDFAKCFKLANFWTTCVAGSTTESSHKMTQAGALMNNYFGIWELPRFILEIDTNFQKLNNQTVQSVAEFASSIFGLGKSLYDGVELCGTRFGLLSPKTVALFKTFNPLGTLVFGSTEAIFKNIPSIQNQWAENPKNIYSPLLKLAKHVALAAIGFLTLIAALFNPICRPWVISTLSTVSVISSISSHFFDALELPPKNDQFRSTLNYEKK